MLPNARRGLFFERPPAISRSPKSKWHDDHKQINEAEKCIRENTGGDGLVDGRSDMTDRITPTAHAAVTGLSGGRLKAKAAARRNRQQQRRF